MGGINNYIFLISLSRTDGHETRMLIRTLCRQRASAGCSMCLMSPRKYSSMVLGEEGADGSLFGKRMGGECVMVRLLIYRIHVGCVTVSDEGFFQIHILRDVSRRVIHSVWRLLCSKLSSRRSVMISAGLPKRNHVTWFRHVYHGCRLLWLIWTILTCSNIVPLII